MVLFVQDHQLDWIQDNNMVMVYAHFVYQACKIRPHEMEHFYLKGNLNKQL